MRCKFSVLVAITVLSACWVVPACADHTPQHKESGQVKSSVEAPTDCKVCGMNRIAFNFSRAVVTFKDGSSSGTCSINCAYEEAAKNPSKKIKSIQIADYTTKNLINAKTAVWVVGGKKPGVMSQIAKWAFSKKKDAELFVKEFGGKITGFDEAWKAAAQ